MTQRKIVLAGGSGIVGTQVAQMLKRRMPQSDLIIAGRNIETAQTVASTVGGSALRIDVNAPVLPDTLDGSLIAGLTNDPSDHLLKLALVRGMPYVDITRWTERLKQGLVTTAGHGDLQAPAVFASAWMASLAGLMVRYASRDLPVINVVTLDILFAVSDQAGPNSAAYMDRLSEPFYTLHNGQWTRRLGMLDGHLVSFENTGNYKTYRFDTPDQSSLPLITGAKTVDARIGFDDRKATALLHLLVRSGIWSLLSRPMFDNVRKAILFNPGNGAEHRIKITVKGQDATGKPVTKILEINDPSGQTHLTALGAVLQIENLLSPAAPIAGSYLGETLLDPTYVVAQLKEENVSVTETFAE